MHAELNQQNSTGFTSLFFSAKKGRVFSVVWRKISSGLLSRVLKVWISMRGSSAKNQKERLGWNWWRVRRLGFEIGLKQGGELWLETAAHRLEKWVWRQISSYFSNQETTPSLFFFSNWLLYSWTDLCIGYINLDALYDNSAYSKWFW